MRVTWIELDPWARSTGQDFHGTREQLQAWLGRASPDGRFTYEVKDQLLIQVGQEFRCERVRTSMLTMSTPWGRYRWIPQPLRRRRLLR